MTDTAGQKTTYSMVKAGRMLIPSDPNFPTFTSLASSSEKEYFSVRTPKRGHILARPTTGITGQRTDRLVHVNTVATSILVELMDVDGLGVLGS